MGEIRGINEFIPLPYRYSVKNIVTNLVLDISDEFGFGVIGDYLHYQDSLGKQCYYCPPLPGKEEIMNMDLVIERFNEVFGESIHTLDVSKSTDLARTPGFTVIIKSIKECFVRLKP